MRDVVDQARLSGSVAGYLIHKETKMRKFFQGFFKRSETAFCGHPVPQTRGTVTAFGVSRACVVPRLLDGRLSFCHDCIGSMTIRCAWCGKPIFLGDMVTLRSAGGRRRDQTIPDHAVILNAKARILVGCPRPECADTGSDYAGFWVPTMEKRSDRWIGGVQPFPSAIEMATESEERELVSIDDLVKHGIATAKNYVIIPARMPLVA